MVYFMDSMKIGVIGLPGAWSTEVLADAIEQRTGYRCVIDFSQVSLDLNNGRALYKQADGNEIDLCQLDGLIVKKISKLYSPYSVDRLYELEWINAKGVPVFSNPASMAKLINRLGCTLELSAAGLPMPETAVAESVSQAKLIVENYGSCVLKPLYSTKARGMCVVNAVDENLQQQLEAFQRDNQVMYMQKKIDLPGQDLGLMFLGGEYIGTYARVSSGESWNTTTQDGGKYGCHSPHKNTIEMAQKAQACFDMAYTVVDVVEQPDPKDNIIFEVSAFGGFRGAKEGCNLDVASLYAEYVINKIKGKKC